MKRGAALSFDSYGFAYSGADAWALLDVSLEVAEGHELWLTGPNAAGKSTLLAAASGAIPHVIEGHVRGAVDVRAGNRHAIASMVLQDSGVYLFRTVDEEIAFVLQNRGVPRSELDDGIRAVLGRLSIEKLRGRLMHTLSGGERQKVAVAAAVGVEPDLLLLDEPFEQLDPRSADEALTLACSLCADGVTLVVATRQPAHVPGSATRLHLIGGRMAEQGPDVVAAPRVKLERSFGNAVLELRDVSFRYPGGPGLDDVSLRVREGECVALLGPNGAGKTTLMKHAIGLLRPLAGRVEVRGADIASRRVCEVASDVGMLFQNPDDQIFNRRVDHEVAWALVNRGMARDAALSKALEALEELGIAHIADENPHECTASQRQLVAFASILVAEPTLYVLDEPTKALDATAAAVVANAVERRLAAGAGALLVTHDVEFARGLADTAVVMVDGRCTPPSSAVQVLSDDSAIEAARLR